MVVAPRAVFQRLASMKTFCLILLLSLVLPTLSGAESPLVPADAAVVEEIVASAGVPTEMRVGEFRDDGPAVIYEVQGDSRGKVAFVYNEEGRVTRIRGNGPWLPNSAWPAVAKLEELVEIYMDHNTPGQKRTDLSKEEFSGVGIEALQNTKLEEILIGHAFSPEGVAGLAKIPSLRRVHIEHAPAVEAEHFAVFAGNPNLRYVGWGSGKGDAGRFFAELAGIPNLEEIRIKEAVITFDQGFDQLAPLKEKLRFLGLEKSIFLPADLERLKAMIPGLETGHSTREQLLEWGPKLKRLASPELQAWVDAEVARLSE